MNKRLFSYTVIALLLFSTSTYAQQASRKFLLKIPALPDGNTCQTSDDIIVKWNDKILALKNEMTELLDNEKQQKEKAQANAQPRMDMFEPANAEKIQKLGEEIQTIETNANTIVTEIVSPYIEEKSNILLKYAGKTKSRQEKLEECRELSLVRRNYLITYTKRLDELMALGVKGNDLSDEMTRMSYGGYTFRTQYGAWMGFLIGYLDELLHFYDDIPTYDSEGYER